MEPKVNLALEAARKGSKELLRFADEVDKLDVIEKGPTDYVTELDHKVEDIIISNLKKTYPKHSYLSEEKGFSQGSGKDFWANLDDLNWFWRIPCICSFRCGSL